MKRAFFLLLGLIFLLTAAILALPKRGPADGIVLVIRHAEKPEVGGGLSRKGMERAEAYKQYFSSYKVDDKPLHLSAIYSSADTQESQRPRVTAQPLATSLHISNNATFKKAQVSALAADIKENGSGKQVLVCWHHGEIPGLLRELGLDVKSILPEGEWPDHVFNWVVELKFDHEGRIQNNGSKCVTARTLPGD